MSSFFPDPPGSSSIKVELDLTNYATKSEVKAITGVDTSVFVKKNDFNNVKTEYNNLKNRVAGNETAHNTDKQSIENKIKEVKKSVADLTVRKSDYNVDKPSILKRIGDLETVDTTLVKKTEFETKVDEIEKKIPIVSDFVKKVYVDTKISETENKIPSVSDFVKKTYVDTNFASKTDLTDANKKITENKSRHVIMDNKLDSHITKSTGLINSLTNSISQISAKGLDELIKSYRFSLGSAYFNNNDGFQNYLVFPPLKSSLTTDGTDKITSWKSIGISAEEIKPVSSKYAPKQISLADGGVSLKFKGSFLVQQSGNPQLFNSKTVNVYLVYEPNDWDPFHWEIVYLVQ